MARLDQILSRYGYCSRGEAEQWIRDGRVTVHGMRAHSSSERAEALDVRIDGQAIEFPAGLLALMHKPTGVVCSHDSGEGTRIYDLLPPRWSGRRPRVTSVGRLDKDATGVILITDIPGLVQRWTSPKGDVVKVYEVTVDRSLDPALVDVFSSGELRLRNERVSCRPARLEISGLCTARLEVIEGLYHQVKRMFASQGYEVVKLHRSRFGDFSVGDLEPGEWRVVPVAGSPDRSPPDRA